MDLITLAMAKAYTDKKAGYSEVKKNILLPMTTLPAGKSAHEAETENDFLVGYEGQVYIVLFDGVKYNCEVGEVTGSVIGVKTDLFMVMAGKGYVDITVTDQTIDHTIEIYQETETIHPIDPKFLPKMVDIWEVSGVDEDQICDTYNGGNSHREFYNFSYADLLNRVKTAVENGKNFIAYFPGEGFYATLTGYSEKCVSFTATYTDVINNFVVVSHYIFDKNGNLRTVGTRTDI